MSHGIIEYVPIGEMPMADCKVFSVVERRKNRRRMIVEPMVNQHLFFTGRVNLPSIEEVIRPAATTTGAACFDFTAFYNQFELPVESRNWYCFTSPSGKLFRMRVIATGQRQCPALAHILTTSIAVKAVRGTQALPTTYIDNVRFAGADVEVCCATAAFRNICSECGVTVSKEPENEFGAHHTFLGLEFNHDDHNVCLAEKTKLKVTALFLQTDGEIAAWTMREFLSMLGILVHALRCLNQPLAMTYWLIKFVRRRARSLLDAPANVWPGIFPKIRELLGICKDGKRDALVPKNSSTTVFTDASPGGYGIVMFDRMRVSILAGRFLFPEDIHVLEARAVCFALEMLEPFSEKTHIAIFIDNTTALHCLRGGDGWGGAASKNFKLASITLRVADLCRNKNVCPVMSYIASADNPADPPSRSRTPWFHSLQVATSTQEC
jgi:hypothetical protein